MSIRTAERRTKGDPLMGEKVVPIAWPDSKGKQHPYILDVPANMNHHMPDTPNAMCISWLWIAGKNPEEVWALPDHAFHFSIWTDTKGRWLDGETNPGAVAGLEVVGFPIPGNGRTSVVSLDDIDLRVWVEEHLVPVSGPMGAEAKAAVAVRQSMSVATLKKGHELTADEACIGVPYKPDAHHK